MSYITYDEFLALPNKGEPTKNLIPGKKYYIQDNVRRINKYKDVYIGIFRKTIRYDDGKIFFEFDDVKQLVKPFVPQTPSGFERLAYKFTEVLPTPTEEDVQKKNINVNELNEFIQEKRAEPHTENPSISFFGQDFRTAKKSFEDKTRPTGGRRCRKSSKTRKSSKGGKRRKRKTVNRRRKH